MVKRKKQTKTLSFKLTLEEYADFWYVAGLFNERNKKPAFLKMLRKLKEILE